MDEVALSCKLLQHGLSISVAVTFPPQDDSTGQAVVPAMARLSTTGRNILLPYWYVMYPVDVLTTLPAQLEFSRVVLESPTAMALGNYNT